MLSPAPKYNSGFTLIETLVAVSILLIAIAAPMFLSQQSLQASRYAGDKLTALYLTQEGIEYVRFVRDSSKIAGEDWLADLSSCIAPNTCYIDAVNQTITQCSGDCPPLKFGVVNGVETYNHATGEDTSFVRSVQVVETVPDKEATISVAVEWMEGLQARTFETGAITTNWPSYGSGGDDEVVTPDPEGDEEEEEEETFNNPMRLGVQLCGNRPSSPDSLPQFCAEEGYSAVIDSTTITSGGACSYYDGSSWQIDGSHSYKTSSVTCGGEGDGGGDEGGGDFIVATGGTVTTDGSYKVHTFTSSGTFTVTSGSGDIEVLVVAGGGGGGMGSGGTSGGGGGGAGGVTYAGAYAVSAGAYSVQVGNSGAGATNGLVKGSTGQDSWFDTLVAIGGGGGGSANGSARTGANGGSGGGGSEGGAGGSGIGGQGNGGGTAGFNGGGGGGGAGQSGENGGGGTSAPYGNGGDGVQYSITGSAKWYAGGGGGGRVSTSGGSGGNGGGGSGGSNNGAGGNASPNTGGGGGGGGQASFGGSGGSGIVIVRYQYQ